MRIAIIATFLAAVLSLASPRIAIAHGTETGAEQRPALLADLVALGGGRDQFRASALRRALAATVPGEDDRLRVSLSETEIARFDDAFTYVVRDSLATMKRSGAALPAATQTSAQAVARELYNAGLHDNTFDVERLFDTLFSAPIHSHAMIAVSRKYGSDGERAYHEVLATLVRDVGKP